MIVAAQCRNLEFFFCSSPIPPLCALSLWIAVLATEAHSSDDSMGGSDTDGSSTTGSGEAIFVSEA